MARNYRCWWPRGHIWEVTKFSASFAVNKHIYEFLTIKYVNCFDTMSFNINPLQALRKRSVAAADEAAVYALQPCHSSASRTTSPRCSTWRAVCGVCSWFSGEQRNKTQCKLESSFMRSFARSGCSGDGGHVLALSQRVCSALGFDKL